MDFATKQNNNNNNKKIATGPVKLGLVQASMQMAKL